MSVIGTEASDLRDNTIELLDGELCPGFENYTQKSSSQIDDLGFNTSEWEKDLARISAQLDELKTYGKNATTHLTILSDFIHDKVNDLEKTYKSYLDYKEKADDYIARVENSALWIYFVIPIAIISGLFCIGVALQYLRVTDGFFQCILDFFCLPLFCVMVLIYFIVGLVIYPVGVLNADFCVAGVKYGSPEDTIEKIMNAKGMNLNELASKVILYYTQGCKADDPLMEVRQFITNLDLATNKLQNFDTYLHSYMEDLSNVCENDYDPMIDIIKNILKIFDTLLGSANSALSLSSCEKINQIYIPFIHDAICTDIPKGIAWIFGTFIFIIYCGMLIITFRSAWKSHDYYLPQPKENLRLTSSIENRFEEPNDSKKEPQDGKLEDNKWIKPNSAGFDAEII
eukprot:CAMPEP_0184866200 /NCGR_PEP_ID=MMETSP0580-20130426/21272_1 /TAXON_ID=1118495 /ORGANISM="Dactyliosolen fragilissimus" /LENGTH=399 /DNA_ID=CAMNT_0027365735 /DNA_START=809 /DNA_END=2008 /DNA_ORIENTATION=+